MASRLDGRRVAAVNHWRRSGTLRPLHAMWDVGNRPCALRRRRVVATLLAPGLGLSVEFLLVGELGPLTPRAWCLPAPCPSWQVRIEDAWCPSCGHIVLCPLIGCRRTPSFSHRPFAVALVRPPHMCNTHSAAVCSLLCTAAVP